MRRNGGRERDAEPIGTADVVDVWSTPFTLIAGHPLRGHRCLFCGSMVGGRRVRSLTVTDFRGSGCSCGSVATVGYLICAEHPLGDPQDACELAIARWEAHHVRPGR